MALEASNASLISRVQCLQYNNSKLAHSADLVIGELSFSKQTDLKLAVFAAIKTLKDDFSVDAIHKVTLMPARRNLKHASGSMTRHSHYSHLANR